MSNVLYANEALDYIKLNSTPIVYKELQFYVAKLHDEFKQIEGMENWVHSITLYLDRLEAVCEATGEEFQVIKLLYLVAPIDQSRELTEKDLDTAGQMMDIRGLYFQINEKNELYGIVNVEEQEKKTNSTH